MTSTCISLLSKLWFLRDTQRQHGCLTVWIQKFTTMAKEMFGNVKWYNWDTKTKYMNKCLKHIFLVFVNVSTLSNLNATQIWHSLPLGSLSRHPLNISYGGNGIYYVCVHLIIIMIPYFFALFYFTHTCSAVASNNTSGQLCLYKISLFDADP